LLVLAPPAPAGGIDLRAPAELAAVLAPNLPDEATPGTGAEERLQQLVAGIVATEGYFSPHIAITEADGDLRVVVEPGPRTLIGAVAITVDGDLDEKTRAALIAGWPLAVGQPFRQDDWSSAKQQLLASLLGEDHAGARLLDSQAEIDPATQRARLAVHYASGPRYRFGELRIEGLQRFPPSLIARYNTMVRPGAPYREADLNALQATLQATPYFRSVRVSLEREAVPEAAGEVDAPVRVVVSERPAHRLSFGAGFSSNTGARVEANYQTPDLFTDAWDFNSGLRLEQKRQTIYADVFLPPGPEQRRNSLGVMAQASDIQGLKSERIAVGGQQVWLSGGLETRLSLTWQDERLQPDGVPESINYSLVPNVVWTWRHVDNPLDPSDGIVLQGQIGGASQAVLSSRSFVRLAGRFQQYFPLGGRDTLSLRGELGYTLADTREGIPQDYVFRTGGTGSVRGYAYQSLGVSEGSAVVGGRYMATASAELTHWLDEQWGVAAFVDAGNAVDSLSNVELAVGYGLGARWRSPAGPLAVDLAYGERTHEVHLHFALAIPF
jgi:translocation and assembly module TamA